MRSKLTKTELLELLHIYKEEKQELLDEKNALVRTVNHWKERHDETFLALKNSVKVVEDFEKKIISKYKKLEEKTVSDINLLESNLLMRFNINDDYFMKLIPNKDVEYECGFANGYVGVTSNHKMHGLDVNALCNDDYRKLDIHVHGGLSYSGKLSGEDPSIWWFGFDTRHSGDNPKDEDYTYCVEQTLLLLTEIIKLNK